MSFKIGPTDIENFRIGSQLVERVYYGSQSVYKRQLEAPTLTLYSTHRISLMTNDLGTTSFSIFIDGSFRMDLNGYVESGKVVADGTLLNLELATGNYTVTAKSKNSNLDYLPSADSNSVTYSPIKYGVGCMWDTTYGSLDIDQSNNFVYNDDHRVYTFTPTNNSPNLHLPLVNDPDYPSYVGYNNIGDASATISNLTNPNQFQISNPQTITGDNIILNVYPYCKIPLSISLTHASVSGTAPAYFDTRGGDLTLTFVADTGYSLPQNININLPSQGIVYYDWNFTTGILTIYQNAITINQIEVEVVAQQQQSSYNVSIYDPSDCISEGIVVWVTPPPSTIVQGGSFNFQYDSYPSEGAILQVGVDGSATVHYYHDTNTVSVSNCNSDLEIYISYEEGASCFAKGTLVTLSDGTQIPIEDVTREDDLLVWNFDEGRFDTAKPLWMSDGSIGTYNVLTFSDGTVLKTVADHRIFNAEAGKFTYVVNGDAPIGTTVFNDKGEELTLVSVEIVEEPVEWYNIITYYHMNLFAEGILTSCRLSNLYPTENKVYVKDERQPVPREVYSFAPDSYYYGLRLAEQPLENDASKDYNPMYNHTIKYIKHLLATDKESF